MQAKGAAALPHSFNIPWDIAHCDADRVFELRDVAGALHDAQRYLRQGEWRDEIQSLADLAEESLVPNGFLKDVRVQQGTFRKELDAYARSPEGLSDIMHWGMWKCLGTGRFTSPMWKTINPITEM